VEVLVTQVQQDEVITQAVHFVKSKRHFLEASEQVYSLSARP
jgi:hypothetical protein